MHINIQPIEKYDDPDNGSTLRVHSVFHTVQGEGPFTGHPAIFIRLAGCNLQCPLCDTEYTEGAVLQQVQAVVARVRRLHPGPRLVVITGGEPFRQNITSLVLQLIDEDYFVQIETNGTLPPPFGFPANTGSFEYKKGAWIVVSPKAGKVHPATAQLAVAWKYVLSHDSIHEEDGLPLLALGHSAKPHIARPPEGFPVEAIYLQPADHKDEEINKKNTEAVIQSCMKHGYTVQLQIHKLLNLE
jgi:organic radical activating enzyme